jgi:hypothetical protein
MRLASLLQHLMHSGCKDMLCAVQVMSGVLGVVRAVHAVQLP